MSLEKLEAHERMAETEKILAGMMPEDTSQKVFKAGGKTVSGPVSLRIEFQGPDDLMAWMKRNYGVAVSSDSAVFEADSLDAQHSQVFVLGNKDRRPEWQRLSVETTFTEGV
jgi:hypothetical protein|tara:strand:+ start:19162 stop:19497 length:336 start_codon:yes stop_codon:yes gene_type:complete